VVNPVGLDACPAGLLDIGRNLGKLICRDFTTPVGLYGLFDLTIPTYFIASQSVSWV
jgi:hypothetical protein